MSGTEPYLGAHSLAGIAGRQRREAPVGRFLTCRCNDRCASNPPHFSDLTQQVPCPQPSEKPELYLKDVPLPEGLRVGQSLRNPAPNICSPDGLIKGQLFIRLGAEQEEI